MSIVLANGAMLLVFALFTSYYAKSTWNLRNIISKQTHAANINSTANRVTINGTIQTDTPLTETTTPLPRSVTNPVVAAWIIQERTPHEDTTPTWRTIDSGCRTTPFTLETETQPITITPASLRDIDTDKTPDTYGAAGTTYNSPHFKLTDTTHHGTKHVTAHIPSETRRNTPDNSRETRIKYTTISVGDEITVSGTPTTDETGDITITAPDETPLTITDMTGASFKQQYTRHAIGAAATAIGLLIAAVTTFPTATL